MTNAAAVGKKVLQGLARGRAIAITQAQAQSQERAVTILYLANADIAAGKPEWGRAGRIARKMGGVLSVSQVRKKLRALSCARDSVCLNSLQAIGGIHEK